MTSYALAPTRPGRVGNVLLWIAQVLLAAEFLFAGGFKLTLPARELAAVTGLPGLFMRGISVAEIAGGLGLLLPGLVRIHRVLTPLAATGLVGVMAGAAVLSAVRIAPSAAVMPAATGLLLVAVVLGRRDWAASHS